MDEQMDGNCWTIHLRALQSTLPTSIWVFGRVVLCQQPFEGLAEYSANSHLGVWQSSTLSRAIWLFGRVLCQQSFEVLAEYSVRSHLGVWQSTL